MPAPLSRDTEPEAEETQLRLLRAATIGRRGALACSLSRTVVELARRALARRRPGAGEGEVLLEFVAIHYGEGLVAGVAEKLSRQRP